MVERHDNSSSASLTLTTKNPYICFPDFCLHLLMGHPAFTLFWVVVRVIFLTWVSPSWLKFSSGSLCNKKWASGSLPCSAARPVALHYPPSVKLVVILQKCRALSGPCTQELAVPSIWKMPSPHPSSLTAAYPSGLGSHLPWLTSADLEWASFHFPLPLVYYSWFPIVL